MPGGVLRVRLIVPLALDNRGLRPVPRCLPPPRPIPFVLREGFADSDLSRHHRTSTRVTEHRVTSVGAVHEADRPGTRSGSSGPEYLFKELRSGRVRAGLREEVHSDGLFLPPPVPGTNGMDQNPDVATLGCVQVTDPGRNTRAGGTEHVVTRVWVLTADTWDRAKSEIIVREK